MFCELYLRYKSAQSESYQFGKSQLFLKAGFYALVEEMMSLKESPKVRTIADEISNGQARKRWKIGFTAVQAAKRFSENAVRAKEGRLIKVQALVRRYLVKAWTKARRDSMKKKLIEEIKANEQQKAIAEKLQNSLKIDVSPISINESPMIPKSPAAFQPYSPIVPMINREKRKSSCDFDVNYSTPSLESNDKKIRGRKISINYRHMPMKSLLNYNEIHDGK